MLWRWLVGRRLAVHAVIKFMLRAITTISMASAGAVNSYWFCINIKLNLWTGGAADNAGRGTRPLRSAGGCGAA